MTEEYIPLVFRDGVFMRAPANEERPVEQAQNRNNRVGNLLTNPYASNSTHGNRKFVHQGRIYFKNRDLKGANQGSISAICDQKDVSGCRGWAWFLVNGTFVKLITAHGCTRGSCGGTATSRNREDLVEENGHHGHLPDNEVSELRAAKDDLIRRQTIPRDAVEAINKLFAYFERNFIRRPNGNDAIYAASLWNMCERAITGLPRTNNGVENWNGGFNGYFRRDSPPLADVVLKLQTDEEKTRQNMEIRARNPVPRAIGGIRSQKANFSGRQIQQLTRNYANGNGLPRLEFLVSISAHLEKYEGQ